MNWPLHTSVPQALFRASTVPYFSRSHRRKAARQAGQVQWLLSSSLSSCQAYISCRPAYRFAISPVIRAA